MGSRRTRNRVEIVGNGAIRVNSIAPRYSALQIARPRKWILVGGTEWFHSPLRRFNIQRRPTINSIAPPLLMGCPGARPRREPKIRSGCLELPLRGTEVVNSRGANVGVVHENQAPDNVVSLDVVASPEFIDLIGRARFACSMRCIELNEMGDAYWTYASPVKSSLRRFMCAKT